MLIKFSAIVLMITMLFGGAATTVRAAEGSLPGQAMYQLKILMEDAQETMVGNTLRLQLSVQQVETRIQEMLQLRAQGKEVPESAFNQLQHQLEVTLRYMAGLSNEELVPALAKVRTRFMAQEQLLARLQSQEGNEDAVLDRIRKMLQDRLRVIGDGTKDPDQFKVELRDRDRDRDSWTDDNPPANGEGSGNGPAYEKQGEGSPAQNGTCTGDCTPAGKQQGEPAGETYGPGPAAGPGEPAQEPAGETYGPGPEAGPGEPNPDPADGVGPGYGEPNPDPGDGVGPGYGEPNPDPGDGVGPGYGEPNPDPEPASGPGPAPAPGSGGNKP